MPRRYRCSFRRNSGYGRSRYGYDRFELAATSADRSHRQRICNTRWLLRRRNDSERERNASRDPHRADPAGRSLRKAAADDEYIAHDIIKGYCDILPNLEFKADCYDAIEALDYLQKEEVDLIFLDLNMPKLKGFDF